MEAGWLAVWTDSGVAGDSTSSFMRKTTKISFSCEHRAALLTALLRAKEAALTAPPPPTADGVPVPPPPPPAAKSAAPTFPDERAAFQKWLATTDTLPFAGPGTRRPRSAAHNGERGIVGAPP